MITCGRKRFGTCGAGRAAAILATWCCLESFAAADGPEEVRVRLRKHAAFTSTITIFTSGLTDNLEIRSGEVKPLLGDLIDPWEKKASLLEEFGGTLTEEDIRWSETEQQMLASLRAVYRGTALFKEAGTYRERSDSWREYLVYLKESQGSDVDSKDNDQADSGGTPGDGDSPAAEEERAPKMFRKVDKEVADEIRLLVPAVQAWLAKRRKG